MTLPRYAIEATCLADPTATGIARYARQLILNLSAMPVAPSEEFKVVQLYRSSRWRRRDRLPQGARLSRQMWRNRLWPIRKRFELIHTPDHRLPHWPGIPKIVTVHDVYSAVGINFEDPATREKQNAIYRDFAARADRIIFDSAHTRSDFLGHFPFDESRTSIVHLGVSADFAPRSDAELAGMRQRHRLERPYLVFLGLQNPNKNLLRLLEAFAASRVHDEFELVLAGKMPDDQRAALTHRVEALGLSASVRFAGYVADSDVPLLYAGAAALMFPSTYEGFGLPILEAMACGTPVLTGNVSSCPEVAAGHAVLVDPYSVAGIAAGIEQAVAMDAGRRDAARAYAATRTWRRTAELTLAAYRAALAAA